MYRKPKYHIFGHIHESQGFHKEGGISFINVAKQPTKFLLWLNNILPHDDFYHFSTTENNDIKMPYIYEYHNIYLLEDQRMKNRASKEEMSEEMSYEKKGQGSFEEINEKSNLIMIKI